MINNNKILTVSYGTFSCTLEGFDDSFGTMKAIAEYFRDLAADDRYFGAEPPQPDAEMLARIAQKEVSRRVQAHEKDGQIFLSALEDHSTGPAEPAAAPEPAETLDIRSQPSAGPEAATAVGLAAVAAVDVDPVAEQIAVEAPEAVDVAPAPEPVADIVPGQSDAEVEAFFEETDAPEAPETIEAETIVEAPAPEAPAPDSIAAKLQRIRAVVAQQDDDEDDNDFLEDEHAHIAQEADGDADAGDVLATARADLEEALEADGSSDADTPIEDDDEMSDILETVAPEDDASPREDSILSMDDDDTLMSDIDAAEENFFDDAADDDDDAFEDAADASETPAETPRHQRAQVIKVDRAELDAAIEAGDLEEYEEDISLSELSDLEDVDTGDSTLSADDEDELAQELAAVEADLAATHVADSEDGDEVDETPAENVRQIQPRQTPQAIDDDPDSDVSRLMAETDTHMEDPDAANRRDAFAQLRAAVAAQKADTAITGGTSKSGSDEAYRDDLAEVVRPRRPVSQSARTERPAASRPAPLKLVAEQRIDVEKPKASGPVRPRRVATVVDAPDTADPDTESFADFAADMGAATLPDLLEAAAAYMSFVEGREEFSRPQLMNTVRQADPEDFSREDGLRSFGQLLRSGKIEKIEGGRFTVSEQIGFKPDERAVG